MLQIAYFKSFKWLKMFFSFILLFYRNFVKTKCTVTFLNTKCKVVVIYLVQFYLWRVNYWRRILKYYHWMRDKEVYRNDYFCEENCLCWSHNKRLHVLMSLCLSCFIWKLRPVHALLYVLQLPPVFKYRRGFESS